MSGENEILGWIRAMLEERGCTIWVDVNETFVFSDPDEREWAINLRFRRNAGIVPGITAFGSDVVYTGEA